MRKHPKRSGMQTKSAQLSAYDSLREGIAQRYPLLSDRLRVIAVETGASYARSRPRAGDWNDDLKILVGRLAEEPVAAAG